MEFQLIQVNFKKRLLAFFGSYLIPLVLYGVFFILNFNHLTSLRFCVVLFLALFIYVIANNNLFTKAMNVTIEDPLKLNFVNDEGQNFLHNIEKWRFNYGGKSKVALLKIIDADKKHIFYFKDDSEFLDFITKLQLAFKKHNLENEKQIINLEKEFYQSEMSGMIFKGLYILNFVFIALWIYDYPAPKFAFFLIFSILICSIYGMKQMIGKQIEI